MEWAQREREREIEEKTWRGDQKMGREEEEKKREGRKKREKREKRRKGEFIEIRRGVVSLVLKRSSDGFEGVDTWFWKRKERRKMGE